MSASRGMRRRGDPRGVLVAQPLAQDAGQPGPQEGQGESRHDLVRPEMDRHDRVEQREQPADEHGRDEPQPGVAARQRRGESGDRAHEHHPLDAQVQDAGALGEDLADRGEQEHRPGRDAGGEDQPQVHQPLASEWASAWAAAAGVGVVGAVRSMRTRYRTRTSATIRLNRMIPWIIAGTPDGWISRPARISAPNRIAGDDHP